MIAAVFDCMVFLQAATNDRSPAAACLDLVEQGDVRLYVSPEILAEADDVLNRPELRARFANLTPQRVATFLAKLTTVAVLLTGVPDAGFPLRDPKDRQYLNLAVAANVSHLVSRDKDLLDLMNDTAFVSRFPNLRVLNPVAFLHVARPAKTP